MFSFFGPAGDYRSPLWTLRLSPALALISLILAQTVWRSGRAHDFWLGLATGQLLVLCIAAFQVTGVTWKNDAQPSDVDDLRLTH